MSRVEVFQGMGFECNENSGRISERENGKDPSRLCLWLSRLSATPVSEALLALMLTLKSMFCSV